MSLTLAQRVLPRSVLPALLAIALLAASVVPVLAVSPPRLTDRVTDQTAVLAARQGEIRAALDRLERDHDVQLWVLFVGTTSGTAITDFADQTARLNSLGVNDALLVVALQDRTDSIWVSDGLPQITTGEIDATISRQVEPRLAGGDFAGAV